MTSSGADRSSAYADLLAALLAARSDPATARFDAEIAAAEAAGTLDGATARTLRWWQRESLRGIADHLGEVLPGLLVALVDAERAADQSVADSAAAWAGATGGRGHGDDGPDDGPHGGPPGGGGGGGGGAEPPAPAQTPGGSGLHEAVTALAPRHDGPHAVPDAPVTDLRQRSSTSAGTGAPRQRLLVAGLTVLSDGARPGDAPSPHTL
jgi:hypothetical protein